MVTTGISLVGWLWVNTCDYKFTPGFMISISLSVFVLVNLLTYSTYRVRQKK